MLGVTERTVIPGSSHGAAAATSLVTEALAEDGLSEVTARVLRIKRLVFRDVMLIFEASRTEFRLN